MEDKAVVVAQQQEIRLINVDEYAMPIERMLAQVGLIQNVMRSVMKKDEHYGVIPGTSGKPSLLKAGAEKLSMTFRLVPSFEETVIEMPNGHREYRIKCTLTHAPTGQFQGQGIGSCSTMESKYRFRTGPVEFTGKPIPKGYWDVRNTDPAEAQRILGGKGYVARKNNTGKWEIARQGERVEHDNPADHFNTVYKMAKKRAHVDAILTATAASDIFTQDVEDLVQEAPAPKQETPPEVVDVEYVEDATNHVQFKTESLKFIDNVQSSAELIKWANKNKARIEASPFVEEIRKAYVARLDTLRDMEQATKAEAAA